MVRSSLLLSICGLLAIALPGRGRAQDAPARTVTLAETVRRARENPPAVLAAMATLERFQAQEKQAKGTYGPKVTLTGQGGRAYNNAPNLSASEVPPPAGAPPGTPPTIVYTKTRFESKTLNALGSGTVDWALVDFARRGNIASARAQTEAQLAGLGAAQRAAVQVAVQLFFTALGAEMLVKDAHLSMQRRSDDLESISALVRAGVRPAVDVQRANIEAVAARHGYEIREIEHATAMAALAAALGEDPQHPLKPVPLENDPFGVDSSLEQATTLALSNRPEIQQAEATLAARQADHRAAWGARLPTLGVMATGQLSQLNVIGSGHAPEGTTYLANGYAYLRWNGLDAATWRKAKVTNAAIMEAQRAFEKAVLDVRADVAAAAYGAQHARAVLDQATEVLASASTTREAQSQRYRAGVATLLDLLDAEGVEQQARQARIEASRDYDLARANLLSACGLLNRLAK